MRRGQNKIYGAENFIYFSPTPQTYSLMYSVVKRYASNVDEKWFGDMPALIFKDFKRLWPCYGGRSKKR